MRSSPVRLAGLAILLGFGTAAADTLEVPSVAYPAIQDALTAAAPGDTVLLVAAAYTGPGNTELDFLGKSLTLRSASGDPDSCTVDLAGSGGNPVRAIVFDDGEGAGARVEGITFTGAWSPSGGTIAVSDGTPTIRDCVISSGNAAGVHASLAGGAALENVTVTGMQQAALRVSGAGTVTATGVALSGNDAEGVSITGAGAVEIEASEIRGNGSHGVSATGAGGSFTATDLLVAGNLGSGVFTGDAPIAISLTTTTVTGNSGGDGGGVAVGAGASATISRTILWGNCASGAGDDLYVDPLAASVQIGCSILDSTAVDGTWTETDTNTQVSPRFCDPASCVDAPTQAGTYAVETGSPALAANSPCGQRIGAFGQGCAAGCALSTTSLDFGALEVGESAALEFTIRNDGNAELTGTVSDAACTHFAVTAGAGAYSLASGDSVVVTVTYTPVSAGSHACTITTGGSCEGVNVTGTATDPPVCDVSSVSLSFGTVEVGSSARDSVTIRNTGGGTLTGTVSDAACTHFSVIEGNGAFALAANDSVVVVVEYAPDTAGAHACTITTGTDCADLSVSGTGELPAACDLSSKSLSFGTVVVGSSALGSFTIKNTGGGTLTGTVSDAGCTHFSVTAGGGPFALSAGDSVKVTVEYAPSTAGPHACTITTGTECADVSVSGNGQLPPVCEVSRSTLDFGTVTIGETADETFAIRNTGGGTLFGSVAESCPDYSLVAGAGPYAIAAGDSVVVTVRYAPSAAGSSACEITTGDSCDPVNASGTGELAPECDVVPTSLDFGTVTVGEVAQRAFTIKNTGGGTVDGVVSEACPEFTITAGAGAYSLGAGDSVVVTVEYAPAASGPAACTIATGAACSDVSGSGIGQTPADCVVTPTSLDFGLVPLGSSQQRSFTIRNDGEAKLEGAVSEACPPYQIVGGAGAYSLQQGDSVVVIVEYTPDGLGQQDCTIATGTACADVSATGVGQEPAECTVSTLSLDFGTVFIGASETRDVVIRNAGGGTVSGDVTESCEHYALLAGGGPFTLSAGDSVVVTLEFAPSVAGTHVCTLETGTDCADVDVTGVGEPAPACVVTPGSLDFGTVTVGESSELDVTIRNDGGGTVTGDVAAACTHFSITGGAGAFALGAGDSVVVTVRYAPTAAGPHTCDIQTGTDCDTVSASGTGEEPPACEITPTSIDFGDVLVGDTLDRSFTIKNTGGGTLDGTVSESCPAYSIESGSGPFALVAGDSVVVNVTFAPTSGGTFACDVEIAGACNDVPLTGNGIGPICEVSASGLSFGTVTVGESAEQSLTIKNVGGGLLEGTLAESCDVFDVVSPKNPDYSLGAGDSLVVTVAFTPDESAPEACVLELGADCGDVDLDGTGELPPACQLSMTELSFGTLIVGQFADLTFTITNAGEGTLTGDPSATCTHFSIVSGGEPYTLGPGASRIVRVRFAPTVPGDFECAIDPGTSCGEVTAMGTAEPPPSCVVSTDVLDFGTITVGQTSQRQFTIQNGGGGTLNGAVTASCDHFTVVQGGGNYSLASGQLVSVVVQFSPQEAGTHVCTIQTGALCDDVEGTGRGVDPPECDVSSTMIDFGTLTVGQSAQRTFTIENVGGGTLTGSVSESCEDFQVLSGGGPFALGAGESKVITVEYAPSVAGDALCTIATGLTCLDVSCSGSAMDPPSCDVSETSIDFGTVEIGQFADRSFVIENVGGGTLTGNVSELCEPYSIVSGGGVFALEGGETVTVTVRFTPTTTDNALCTVTTGTSCANVALSGLGEEPPACVLDTEELDFGTIAVGSSSEESVTIQNGGGGTLTGTVAIDCEHFEIIGGAGPYALASGESRQVTIRYVPTAEGSHECTVDVGDACAGVSCTGTAVPASECLLSATSLSFGTVTVGQTSDERTFTITNTGGLALTGDVTESCDHYEIVAGGGPFTLLASQQLQVAVVFSPTVAGTHQCTIETGTNCADVICTGIGEALPTCGVTPATLDFGTVEVGDFVTRSFEIRNAGGGTLVGNVSEGCPDYQIIQGSGGYALGAGQVRNVTVRFAPTSPGAKVCDIQTGLLCESVACSGVGESPPDCAIMPASLDFGTVSLGSTEMRSFTITNTGGGTLAGSVSENCPEFSLVSGGGPFALGPGESREVTVAFSPVTAGPQVCTIGAGVECAGVTASGVGGNLPVCVLEPDAIDFGVVNLGDRAVRSFVIRNEGLGTFSGNVNASCAHFSILAGGGAFMLAAGDSVVVTVEYEPSAVGVHGCSIATGASCSDVDVSGVSQLPQSAAIPMPQVQRDAYQLWSLPILFQPASDPRPPMSALLDDIFRGDWTGGTLVGSTFIPDAPLTLGRGFWLQAGRGVPGATEVMGDLRTSTELPLEVGWNVIGTVDTSDVDVSTLMIRRMDGELLTPAAAYRDGVVSGVLFDYVDVTADLANDGEWMETRVTDAEVQIPAWRGRLLYAYEPVDLLYGQGGLPPVRIAAEARGGDPAWQISLAATSGGLTDRDVTVGVADSAQVMWDRFDVPHPPLPGAGLTLAVDHRSGFDRPDLYRRSMLPPGQRSEWPLVVSGAETQVTISWSGLAALPDELDAYLVLPETAVPMREVSSYTFESTGAETTLSILVTSDPYEGPVLGAEPGGLIGVYPMPYTHDTMRISYRVTREVSTARMRVHDAQGRLVRDLGDVPGGTGTWEVLWNGRDRGGKAVGSGVYYIRLRLGGSEFTIHQVVVR